MFAKGTVIVEDTGLDDIAVEDIVVVETSQVDIEVLLIQLGFVPHYSLGRYPLFSLEVDEVLCSPFHHDLPIYKMYNID